MRINEVYNNAWHFSNGLQYDTHQFLKELGIIADSVKDKVMVHGGIHTDAYGHASGIIGQLEYTQYGTQYYPALTRDTYIHFTIHTEGVRRLHALNTTNAFHFLVKVPHIIKLHLPPKVPVLIRTNDENLTPTSSIKKVKFIPIS